MNAITYKEKVLKIITINDYTVNLLKTIPGITGVYNTYSKIINCTDYPFISVLYLDGELSDIREKANFKLSFDIILKNNLSDGAEMDNLNYAALIMEKFEDYSLGGNCIGLTPKLPRNYYDSTGENHNVNTVVSIEVEI
jgi:hypothetical protein